MLGDLRNVQSLSKWVPFLRDFAAHLINSTIITFNDVLRYNNILSDTVHIIFRRRSQIHCLVRGHTKIHRKQSSDTVPMQVRTNTHCRRDRILGGKAWVYFDSIKFNGYTRLKLQRVKQYSVCVYFTLFFSSVKDIEVILALMEFGEVIETVEYLKTNQSTSLILYNDISQRLMVILVKIITLVRCWGIGRET